LIILIHLDFLPDAEYISTMKKITYPDNLRAHLYRRFKWFENQVLELAKNSKYHYLSLSQIRVFAFLRGCDMTISDLAKLMNISRQAAQKTVSSLLDLGLVELTESPKNLSAKMIKVTVEGQKIQQWSRQAIDHSERLLASKIGPEKLKLLKEILNKNWD